jgi:hypothetical protein
MDKNMIKSDFDLFGDVEYTVDHDMIRRWIGAHHGHPARLKDTGASAQGKQSAIHLRIRFPRMPESETRLLEDISWDNFWSAFEAERLAMEYVHERAEGKTVPMVRFVNRDTAQADNSALSDPAAYQVGS